MNHMCSDNYDTYIFTRDRIMMYLKLLEESNNIFIFLIERYNLDIKINNLDSMILNNISRISINKSKKESEYNVQLQLLTDIYKGDRYNITVPTEFYREINITVPIELFYTEIEDKLLKEKIKDYIRNIHMDILNQYKNKCINKMKQQIEYIETTDKLIEDLNI